MKIQTILNNLRTSRDRDTRRGLWQVAIAIVVFGLVALAVEARWAALEAETAAVQGVAE